MSTDNNTTNIPVGALQISLRGRYGESNSAAFARYLTALFNVAHVSRRDPVVLRVHGWDYLNEVVRDLVELLAKWPRQSFRTVIAWCYDDETVRIASDAFDAIVFENVAVRIADGDNPRWIELANQVG